MSRVCSVLGEWDRKAPGKSYRCPGHRVLSAHQRDTQAPGCSFSGWIDSSQLQSPRQKER